MNIDVEIVKRVFTKSGQSRILLNDQIRTKVDISMDDIPVNKSLMDDVQHHEIVSVDRHRSVVDGRVHADNTAMGCGGKNYPGATPCPGAPDPGVTPGHE